MGSLGSQWPPVHRFLVVGGILQPPSPAHSTWNLLRVGTLGIEAPARDWVRSLVGKTASGERGNRVAVEGGRSKRNRHACPALHRSLPRRSTHTLMTPPSVQGAQQWPRPLGT